MIIITIMFIIIS